MEELEAESIFLFRQAVAEFNRPVLLYSSGKDSSVLLHLLRKAFYPARIPIPLLHVDTGFKFPEMYDFRQRMIKTYNVEIIVHRNEDAIANNTNPVSLGTQKCCGLLKTQGLLQAMQKYEIDCAIGGARREEEKSRAKERLFSFRDQWGQWHPKRQRPELWNLFNSKLSAGESVRVFPLSNWTELNIWQYIRQENIEVVPLYFAQARRMIIQNQQLIPVTGEHVAEEQVIMSRFRTLGCMPCTGAVASKAQNLDEIIAELEGARVSERATRVIDHDGKGSMEMKKREGYF